MIEYYNRDGIPVDVAEYDRLLRDFDYRCLARTKVADPYRPEKTYGISTVWLGLDYSFGAGPPMIFEMMVFALDGNDPMHEVCIRYATEDEARKGHTSMVIELCVGLNDPVIEEIPAGASIIPTP